MRASGADDRNSNGKKKKRVEENKSGLPSAARQVRQAEDAHDGVYRLATLRRRWHTMVARQRLMWSRPFEAHANTRNKRLTDTKRHVGHRSVHLDENPLL